jgi:hypothetical protein
MQRANAQWLGIQLVLFSMVVAPGCGSGGGSGGGGSQPPVGTIYTGETEESFNTPPSSDGFGRLGPFDDEQVEPPPVSSRRVILFDVEVDGYRMRYRGTRNTETRVAASVIDAEVLTPQGERVIVEFDAQHRPVRATSMLSGDVLIMTWSGNVVTDAFVVPMGSASPTGLGPDPSQSPAFPVAARRIEEASRVQRADGGGGSGGPSSGSGSGGGTGFVNDDNLVNGTDVFLAGAFAAVALGVTGFAVPAAVAGGALIGALYAVVPHVNQAWRDINWSVDHFSQP